MASHSSPAQAPGHSRGHGFGTAPVFLAAISTILGAVLFLRFGYAVGHTGMMGAMMLVLIGHAITIPTGLAVAEIATNLKVEGGGEYFIISRSFGATVGGAIGVSLYLSQAISVAFYVIAFAEAFQPVLALVAAKYGIALDPRVISVPAALLLCAVIARKGADIGVGALWVVVGVLAVSLAMFFLGGPTEAALAGASPFATVERPDNFFVVFAIIFPAFTGMTAGVGLSGDLKNPRRSIPLGTVAATLAGMAVYILVVLKMVYSATPAELAGDQFIMSRIAVWGPIIPIGLAAATISSALGSILVAPRTLQALSSDRILPVGGWNRFLSRGRGASNEPVNATLVTAVIVVAFVALGDVDVVAQIISMFFMITYGALNAISFLEHFAGNPSYRPTFRTKWFLSLLGAVASFFMMFQMQPVYALLALITMALIYLGLRRGREEERDLSAVIKGVLFQMTRQLQVMIQKSRAKADMSNWRPSFIAISDASQERIAAFELLRWLSHYYGFGTYIHLIPGALDAQTKRAAEHVMDQLIEQVHQSGAVLYVNTIVSPSQKTAVAQIVQMPGIAGMENNSILFEFPMDEPEQLDAIAESCGFALDVGFNICVLRSSDRRFGYHSTIHIWLTPEDLRNANLMIILAYILIGHPEWSKCEIQLFATFQPDQEGEDAIKLNRLISRGSIPISAKNVERVPYDGSVPLDDLVSGRSSDADLVITGFSPVKMVRDRGAFLRGFEGVHDILFVHAGQDILITRTDEDDQSLLEADVEAEEQMEVVMDAPSALETPPASGKPNGKGPDDAVVS